MKSFVARWIAILGIFGVISIWLMITHQPEAEPGYSIRMFLINRTLSDEAVQVSVIKQFSLYNMSSHRIDLVLALINDKEGYHLAHFHSTGSLSNNRSVRNNWSTYWNNRRTFETKPTRAQTKEYDSNPMSRPSKLADAGWLPRPADKIDFEPNIAAICISQQVDNFDPNEGIDATVLLNLIKYGGGGRQRLGRFAFAPFHEPRWFSATKCQIEVKKLLRFLEIPGRENSDPVSQHEKIKTLRVVSEHLKMIGKFGLRFHFIARN